MTTGQTMIYTVEHDGKVFDVEGPEGATPEQLQAFIQQGGQSDAAQPEQQPGFDASEQNPAGTSTAGTQYAAGFDDELPTQAKSALAPEDEAHVVELLKTGRDSEAVRYAASKGFRLDNIDQIAAARQQTGKVNPDSVYNLPDVKALNTDNAIDAAGRGAADAITVGASNKIGAFGNAVADTLTGDADNGFWSSYNRHADERAGIQDADEENHPIARGVGQLLGGLMLPAGMEGVAFKAGKEALRSGATMQEARAVAAAAVRNRSAAVGAGYAAAHGALSADTPGEALTGALAEGALGAASGAAVGQLGMRATAKAARAPSEAQQFAAAADRLKVDYLPADKPGAIPTQWATSLTNLTLGGIPLTEAAERVVGTVKAARDRLAGGAGRVADKVGAGEAAQSGASAFIKQTGDRGSKLYEAIPIAGKRDAVLTNVKGALADLTAGLESNKALSALVSDPKLQSFRSAIEGTKEDVATGLLNQAGEPITKQITKGGKLSWEDLKAFRSYVGEKAGQPSLSSDTSQAALKKLYGALSDDMRATAAAESPKALVAFNRANTYWRGRQDRIETVLSAVLGKDLNKGEQSAFERIQSWSNEQGGDPVRLGRLMRSLPPEDAGTVRASVIQRLGTASKGRQDADGDVFSPAEFLTHWNALAPRAKAVLFQGDTRQALDDLALVAGGMKASSKFANTSKTGIAVGAASTMSAVVANPVMGALYVAGQIGAGKLLGSPKVARWLASYAKKPNAAAGLAKVQGLTAIARAEPAIANEVLQLQQRLAEAFTSVPTRLAAQEAPDGVGGGQGQTGDDQAPAERLEP